MTVIDAPPAVVVGPTGAVAPGSEASAPVVAPPADPAVDVPRRTRTFTRLDYIDLALSAVAAAAFVSTIFTISDWSGPLSFFCWWLVSFVAAYRLVVSAVHGGVVGTDRVMTVIISIGALLTVAALVWVVTFVAIKGWAKFRPSFFTETMATVGPLDDGGGAYHAIVGTLMQVGMATVVAVPAAILTAIYLHEIKGRFAPVIRFFIDAMSGLPSIVAGLLVYTIWVVELGRGYAGVAASAALTILMLPTVTRTAEEVLRTIPDTLREASLALGAPQWRVVLRTVVPTAGSGLVTAAILGVARSIGETAPILLTASYAASVNNNPIEGKQASLPMFVYQLVKQPNQTQIDRAWTGALVLLIVVLVLFVLARFISERGRRKRGM